MNSGVWQLASHPHYHTFLQTHKSPAVQSCKYILQWDPSNSMCHFYLLSNQSFAETNVLLGIQHVGTAVHSEWVVCKRICTAQLWNQLLVDLTGQATCRIRTLPTGMDSIGYSFSSYFQQKETTQIDQH